MKTFLASVGNAQLLGKKAGQLVHIADVRTLTESTLSFNTTMEEVRAGQGAKLYGRFAHDSGMTVTLTDAMWDLNYIAMQVGSAIDHNGTAFETESFDEVVGTSVTVQKDPTTIGSACGLDHALAWFRAKGCEASDEWVATDAISGKTITIPDGVDTTNGVCVKYFANQDGAKTVTIPGNFIPAELVLILTTQLFAGDASAPETGKPVGHITVKIPRFQLDGTFDLNMAMSSAATTSLSGVAQAVDDGTCDGEGIYAEIVEVIAGRDFKDGLRMIAVDNEYLTMDDIPKVYGLYSDGYASLIDNAKLTFAPALAVSGKWSAAESTTVTVPGTAIKDTVTITAG